MERINLPKDSITKKIILSGLVGEGFTLAKRTNCLKTPLYLYYNNTSRKVAIVRCMMTTDELVIVGYKYPAKLKILIDEFKTLDDNCHNEVVRILEQIIDDSYFTDNYEVTYL